MMAEQAKRPALHGLGGAPAARQAEPLGALWCLPKVLLIHLCSFLSGQDLVRFGATCASLHYSSQCVPSRLRLRSRGGSKVPEEENEDLDRCFGAMTLLASRASAAVKELRIEEPGLIEPFCSAVQGGGQALRTLTSLHVTLGKYMRITGGTCCATRREIQLLADLLLAEGRLPLLQELYLSARMVESVAPLWEAIGKGACPRLERIYVASCSSQHMEELAAALVERPESCATLRALHIKTLIASRPRHDQARADVAQALLSRLASCCSLEELVISERSFFTPALPRLLAADWPALKTLVLSPLGRAPCPEALLHALARGAMPSLTCLDLTNGVCSDEAWRALGEAMGPEGTCLRRLKTLGLCGVIEGPRQLEILCRAMGSGHGCPELEVMDIRCTSELEEPEQGLYGAALAPAFRPPHGLPRLKELHISFMELTDLDQLVEALQHRPHASQPMEVFNMNECALGTTGSLGRAMVEGRGLDGLKELSISASEGSVSEEEWALELFEALAGGAGQQLEKIQWKSEALSVDVANRLLQALATQGACPRLHSLLPRGLYASYASGIDVASLGVLLRGEAVCSATLRELRLDYFQVDGEGTRALAACLQAPGAVQLESLILCVAEHQSTVGVMELLGALQGRAGSRLRFLSVRLKRCDQSEAMPVVDHLVDMIDGGGLPAVRLSSSCKLPEVFAGYQVEPLCKDRLEVALQRREATQWRASWCLGGASE